MSKIAITGTIASGKSTCSDYLRSLGFYVMDLDKVNSDLLNNDSCVLKEIQDSFKEAFDGNTLDRKKLASIIFNDLSRKKQLEDILYPRIIEVMKKEMKRYNPFFCEVPLLFESGFDIYFDESWLIVSDDEASLFRLLQKGYTEKEAEERIRNQMSIEEKKKRATKIIYNKNTFDLFKEEIRKALDNCNAWK